MIYHKLDLMTEKTENYLFNFPLVWLSLINKRKTYVCLSTLPRPEAKNCILQKSQNDIHTSTEQSTKVCFLCVAKRFIHDGAPTTIHSMFNNKDTESPEHLFRRFLLKDRGPKTVSGLPQQGKQCSLTCNSLLYSRKYFVQLCQVVIETS